MKRAIKAGMLIISVLVIATAVMWVFKICPPEGPWPMPPWCESSPTFNKSDETSWEQPQEYLDMIQGSDWKIPDADIKIATGHTLMDIYNTFLFQNRFESSITSMKKNNAQWVVYDNYWSYHSINPPVIGPYVKLYTHSFRHAREEEIGMMIKSTHESDMKFALMIELNFDVAKGSFTNWEEERKFWTDSAAQLEEMGKALSSPTAEVNAYWDEWFKQYTECVLSNAAIAQKYGADMLVIGKQLDGAVKEGNTQRWKDLIVKVREVYEGPISYAGYTNNYFSQFQEAGFMADLDYITIYLYNSIDIRKDPSIAELKASLEKIIDTQIDYYAEKSGKKVILMTPFQSREFGANQEWFEPADEAPDIAQDLLIQAKMYEALFQALEDEENVEMVWTWGYWWLENDFNRDEGSAASFEKSSSIRNKPAAEVIKRWSR